AKISEVLGDIQGMTELNWSLIPIYRTMRRTKEEEAALGQLLQTAFNAGSLPMQARVYAEWGDAFAHRGDLNAAIENYIRGLSIATQASEALQEIELRSRLAYAYAQSGSRDEAFRTFTDGLVQSDRTPGAERVREEMLVRTGNIYLRERDYANADRFFEAALQSAIRRNDKLLEGYLFLQRGHCSVGLNPRSSAAMQNYEIALDLFSSYSYNPGIAYARASLGISEWKSGRLGAALEHLGAAVMLDADPGSLSAEGRIIGECEETFYQLHGATLREAYLEVLLFLGQYDEAFRQNQKDRADRIAETLQSLKVETGRQGTNASVWEVQRNAGRATGAVMQQRILLSEGAVDQAVFAEARVSRTRYGDLESKALAELDEASGDGVEILIRRSAPGVAEIQRRLPAETALVTCIPTSRTLFVFAIRSDQWAVELAAVDRASYRESTTRFASLLQEAVDEEVAVGGNAQEIRNIGTTLYSQVIRPVRGMLSGAGTMVFIPDADLFPLHALPVPGGARRYLIEDVSVSYLPIASALLFRKASQGPSGLDIVGLGHPGAGSWDVEYELRDIQAFHKPARLYFGTDATFVTLTREQGYILHLAAEFSYDADWPGNSVIRLSNGQSPKGYSDISWGSLFSIPPFPGVLLSDLNAAGAFPAMKPILFLANGTSSVIATSAQPRRKTRKMFGELFYTSMLSELNVRTAYRNALTGMIDNEEFAMPEVWAPFYLWGF
ncbi:MAG: CHAT domain-containing tetratricopeptide repeat protein, partial [Ignavibacteria bacterium]|nr:CHAT domain-containing tetratricopeptide repeat protein [Ignavibacteria bacterium]